MFERNLHLRDMLEGVLDSMSINIQRAICWLAML